MRAVSKRTALRLWHTAPYWRYSVIGAGAFGALFIVSLVLQPSTPSVVGSSTSGATPSYAGPAPISDPATESRLKAYENALAAVDASSPGQKCEGIATAFGRLSDSDIAAGRNVLRSSAARIKALSEGQRCQSEITSSDRRFADLASAVAAADHHPGSDAGQAVGQAYGNLTSFDKSRGLYTRDNPLIVKAGLIVKDETESRERIEALTEAVTALQTDRGPAAYVRAADALHALTESDRARLTPDQHSMIGAADAAAQKIDESRSRLDQVAQALAAANPGQGTGPAQSLVDALARITPFDEAVASSQQKDMLSRARIEAAPFAWSLLQNALGALAEDGNATHYETVSRLSNLLANNSLPRTPDQTRLLAQAQQAAGVLQASDERLHAMQDAATAWKQTGLQAHNAVLAALHDTTAFDRSRFDATMAGDWNVLQQASMIVSGPEIGLTTADRDRMPIFVFTYGETERDRQFVNSLRNALSAAGYRVTDKQADATLLTEVSIEAVSDPALDTSGEVATYSSTAKITAATRWASGDSVLFFDRIDAPANAGSPQAARVGALLVGIDRIVAEFQRLTAR